MYQVLLQMKRYCPNIILSFSWTQALGLASHQQKRREMNTVTWCWDAGHLDGASYVWRCRYTISTHTSPLITSHQVTWCSLQTDIQIHTNKHIQPNIYICERIVFNKFLIFSGIFMLRGFSNSTQPSIPPGSVKWGPASARKAKGMIHTVHG